MLFIVSHCDCRWLARASCEPHTLREFTGSRCGMSQRASAGAAGGKHLGSITRKCARVDCGALFDTLRTNNTFCSEACCTTAAADGTALANDQSVFSSIKSLDQRMRKMMVSGWYCVAPPTTSRTPCFAPPTASALVVYQPVAFVLCRFSIQLDVLQDDFELKSAQLGGGFEFLLAAVENGADNEKGTVIVRNTEKYPGRSLVVPVVQLVARVRSRLPCV